MGTTSHFGFRYQEHDDPPQGHLGLQHLAEDVEAAMVIRSAKKTAVGAEQSTTAATYSLLGTPDRVQNIEVPTDGLLLIGYRAQWKITAGGGAGAATLFVDADQVKVSPGSGGAAAVQQALTPLTANRYGLLTTSPVGLVSTDPAADEGVPVTTGQILGSSILGGLVVIGNLAADTYDVAVKYRSDGSATLSAKNRKLWVASLAFA